MYQKLCKIGFTILLCSTIHFNGVHAAVVNWNVGTGAWDIGTNWDTATQPAAGDSAFVDNGGEAILTTIAPPTGILNQFVIGNSTPSNNRITVLSGGVLNANSGIAQSFIGAFGTGTLNVLGGEVNCFNILVGFNAAGVGTINVNGTGSVINDVGVTLIGAAGKGDLNVSNGGFIQSQSASIATGGTSQGQATITDPGSIWNSATTLLVGTNGAAALTIQNGGHVTTGSTTTIAQNATSTGTLNLFGTDAARGTLTTRALQKFSGTAQVNFDGGVLQASQNQANFINFSTTPLNVLAGGAYIDSQGFTIDTASSFTGVGLLNKLGTGVLTLNGNNTCGGGNVLQGTLVINGSFNGPTNVNPNAALAVNGLLNGPVNVGTNAFALVNGIIAGPVNNDGLLKGTGTVGNLNNSGIVAPGNPMGTLTVAGNFINNSNGVLETEVNAAGQADLLQVNGAALLNGGTLDVIGAPGNYVPGTQYTIITAGGGLFGTFANYINNLPIHSFLTYLPNALILNLGNPLNNLMGLRGNPLRVANYINSFPVISGDFLSVLSALNTLDPNQLSKALDQLHPAPFQASAFTASDAAHLITEGFTDRLTYLRRINHCNPCCNPCGRNGAWISGVADFLRQGKTQGLRSFATDTQGVAVGYDNNLCDALVVGLGGGYTHSHVRWNRSYGHINVNSGYAGFYASHYNCNYYIDGALLGFVNYNRARRHIEFSSIDRRAKSKYHSYGFNPHLGAGLFMDVCSITVVPYVELDYYYVRQNKFHERGAESLNLHVRRNYANLARLETGVNLFKCYTFNCGTLIPNLSLGYVANRLLSNRKYRSSFNNQPNSFTVFGTDHCFNQFEVGFDVSYLYNDCIGINFAYEAELGKKRREQEFNLNININF